ncbi:amidase [Variovorax ginsengisoli]|uniref:Asp-tRNA(Asn)/Glu-tRNA(Gln) amidotransferase A subunit family amidase n=1 Tax=Variovorax ginsengisoli TaxID=363844 RepID=A0ABT9SGE0_9BURK|nr:amidase [Variovorax ginsengisoli]MDP9902477.1 Asp-tRNA(Asn)/Glu-tRNA(Gln) amidotransferase A subunit family amidase [Variovorax ginsengisoli]
MTASSNPILPMSATRIRKELAGRSTSARAVLEQSLDVVAVREPTVHAWKVLGDASARRWADALDGDLDRRDIGLLAGIPVAVKDLMDTADMPTGYGSAIYAGHQPTHDAACVTRLREAGATILGKTVTTEFAYFAPGETTNPWDASRTPGGSSSGSAAAVASGMVPLALGSQTAGSLIRPASYCGVFALKPTHGVFDLRGVKGLSPSLDTLGWLARTADDLELMRCALLGAAYAPLDRWPAAPCRIGFLHTHEWSQAQPDGQAAFDEAVQRLQASGMQLIGKRLPDEQATLADDQMQVMAYEAVRELAFELQHHAAALSRPLRELLEKGQAVTEAEYLAAQSRAATGRRVARELMADVDALLVPAAPGEAPRGLDATGDPVFSRVWTLLGLPCVNVPGLRGPHGMPIGVQLVGRKHQERALLALAASVHTVLDTPS